MPRLFAYLMACCLFASSAAADLATPRGPVILTVTGNISSPNRGALDPFQDAFFAHDDVTFDKAAAFDLAMLEGLGMKTITTGHHGWPGKFSFEGPLLRDVLAAAGAEGRVAKVVALDGYGADISMERLEKFPVILALKRDGAYLGLGRRGQVG